MATRRMPVEDNWFDKKMNDVLYGFMYASATYNKQEKRLYYSKIKFQKDKKILQKIVGASDIRPVNRKIAALKEQGYISEDKDNFYFPYNRDNFYLMMDKELLFYICSSMSEFSLKCYVYLADKARAFENYRFTLRELVQAFGYAGRNQSMEKVLTNCLALLEEAKLIHFHSEYVDIPNPKGEYKVPNLILDWVATELPDSTKEIIEGVFQEEEEQFEW